MSTATTDDPALDEDLHEDPDGGDDGADGPESAPPAARPSTPTPHIPGGIPAVPLTVIGANSTVAAVSAAVVTAGAATTGLAAAGLAVTAMGATALTRRAAAKTAAGRTGATGGKSASGSARTRTGSTSGGLGGRRSAAGGGKVPRARSGSASGSRNSGTGGRSGARALRASGQTAHRRAAAAGAAKNARGALGAVKAVRAARQAAAPTRAQRRAKDTADARRLSDARRAAKAQRKAARRAAKGKGTGGGSGSGRTAGLGLRKSPKPAAAGGGGRATQGKNQGGGRRGAAARRDGARQLSMRERARQARRRARDRFRRAQDQRTACRLSRLRDVRRRARARMRMWRRLTASALRCYGRKLLAAGLSIPFFAIGLITHPIGVRLGWNWLQYLGPRVYRRLANAADRARAERDRTIRDEYETAVEAAAERDDHPVAAQVRRAPRHHLSTGGSTSMSTPAGPGFLFNESAADMEAAAQAYDPDGMMHVHDTIQGFPDALDSVANTFAILAKKADEEFPLEPEVGAALDDIYKALQQAIDQAEEAFKVFCVVHEQDIKRHTDPRNGAEEKWDTTNN
ncbi:hypothetical protein [Streptomyces sp. NPDC053048]|uniref:hypothetical protein n=1 Tax=Streptomyces sp. NPDC053048 TaxID=3365694 RepID=UPI0037D2757F